jgi:putative ABC transport system substrate-binding protein
VLAVPAEVSPELQATWLRRLHTQARRVGLLYDPDLSARQVAHLTAALQRVGLQAIPEPVRSPTALPAALTRLGKRADLILGLHDRTVFTPQTAKAILLFSFRARIPVIGLSDAWVKAGALYALEPDYEDLGRQCGLAALRLVGLPRELPQQPARLVLSINLRTARHMRIDWPAEIRQMASKTHE